MNPHSTPKRATPFGIFIAEAIHGIHESLSLSLLDGECGKYGDDANRLYFATGFQSIPKQLLKDQIPMRG